jgi:hypothetical protein
MASRRLALNLKVGAASNQHIVNVEDRQPAADLRQLGSCQSLDRHQKLPRTVGDQNRYLTSE